MKRLLEYVLNTITSVQDSPVVTSGIDDSLQTYREHICTSSFAGVGRRSAFLDTCAGSCSLRSVRHAAFLDIGDGSIDSDADTWSAGGCSAKRHSHALPTAFAAPVPEKPETKMPQFVKGSNGMKLGKVKLRLMYQTPEIYKTNFGDWMGKLRMSKFACMTSGVEPMPMRPMIQFLDWTRKVWVQLTDTTTNKVLWDAQYSVGLIPKIGGFQLMPFAKPDLLQSPKPIPMKICIPNNDPGPRLFDLKICSRDLWYTDQMDTQVDDTEGWHSYNTPCAHIGVEAYRTPIFRGKIAGNNIPIGVSKWSSITGYSPTNYSAGDIHVGDPMDHIMHKEVNLLENNLTGDNGKRYYDWIYTTGGRDHMKYEYLKKVQPLQLVNEFKETPPKWKRDQRLRKLSQPKELLMLKG